jgi:hypothetical protein
MRDELLATVAHVRDPDAHYRRAAPAHKRASSRNGAARQQSRRTAPFLVLRE